MATIVMNMDGCDIAHEALKLKEYGEEAMCSGQYPQCSPAGESPVVKISRHAPARERALTPDVALSSAQEEVIDSVGSLLSTAFPKCP